MGLVENSSREKTGHPTNNTSGSEKKGESSECSEHRFSAHLSLSSQGVFAFSFEYFIFVSSHELSSPVRSRIKKG